MKKLTKTTALILSVLMLFGCTSNSARLSSKVQFKENRFSPSLSR